MSKIVYTGEAQKFSWRHIAPWCIVHDLLKHRSLIASMTIRDLRSAYQATYLGVIWQVILPMIMLAIFYFVFGRILGGRFLSNATETPVDYALALFIGLGFFNYLAQNIGNASSLVTSNVSYVKSLSFPLEILSVISVLNVTVNLVVGLFLSLIVFVLAKGYIHWSAICLLFYISCIFLIALGLSWGLSALAVFIRDVAAVTSPLTLILMFMCPIFYPASMVPKNVKWIISVNPLSLIIEDARGALLYGVWPHPLSVLAVLTVSLCFAIGGYAFFMKTKADFADVI